MMPFSSKSLPVCISAALQVSTDLGVASYAVVEGHQFGVVAEHGLVLHIHVFHATVEHHITPHHLKY